MRVIVGIDPGATVGIAVVDANSRTQYTETARKRNFSYSEILKFLSDRGEPLIVATDKARPPLLVRKIAAAFGARLCYPNKDISVRDKKEITKQCSTGSDHEQDALAAALHAKQQFADTFAKVERSVEEKHQGAVKKMLVTGQAANVETALEILESRKEQRLGKERVKERDRLASRLAAELEDARARNAALEREAAELRKGVQDRKYERDEGAAMERLRESTAKLLAEKNRTTGELEKLAEGRYIIVVNYSPRTGMSGKAVIADTDDDAVIREIEQAGAAAIITDRGITSALPVIRKRKANIKQAGKFLVIEKPEVGEDFAGWLEAYKEKRKMAEQTG